MGSVSYALALCLAHPTQAPPPPTRAPQVHARISSKPTPGPHLRRAGWVLLGLGWGARALLDGFWLGRAKLSPAEPFGHWSRPQIMLLTGMTQALALPGMTMLLWDQRRRPTSPHRETGRILLFTGLSILAVSRSLTPLVLDKCQVNGCAYGWLEGTFWSSAALGLGGVLMGGATPGRAESPRITFSPRGVSWSQRF